VEVRSLNNRFLKTVIKLPDVISFAEPEVERIIRDQLSRGSVTYTLHMRYIGDEGAYAINVAMLEGYLAKLEQVQSLRGGDGLLKIDLSALTLLPGVCQSRQYSEQENARFLEAIKELTHGALQKLRKMRTEEGQRLLKDLQEQCSEIRKNLIAITELTGGVVDSYRKRIEQRVNEMLTEANLKVDEEMLRKEVAIFAERCDINEEILRLGSHLDQFMEVCRKDEQAGRRLDFLTQEMLREANTIASKANDARISQHVVEIKVAIDRLREQVQNIE
jgi:uncharacterized protein (TIGR00255 family)